MSNEIFPTFAGITFDTVAAPTFSTKVHRSASGYEVRAAYMLNPLWKFSFKFDLIRDNVANNELKTLLGFFNARLGQYDNFLYSCPGDNSVVAGSFGVGTGTQTAFQLIRSYGGFLEVVNNLNGAPQIYVGGVLQSPTTNYTVSATGLITFTIAPAAFAALTWTGAFFYRCRFVADSIDPTQFMRNLYNLNKLELIGSPMNKV